MKKAPIAVALVLVFGLFAAAFSLAPAIAQYTPPSDSTTSTSSTDNATGTGNTTSTNATGAETFSASGSIATLIFDTGETTTTSEMQNETTTTGNEASITGNATGNATTSLGGNTTLTMNETSTSNETATAAEELEEPYVLSGEWNLDVQDGSVSDFAANFTMVHTDGTGRHTHDLSNFVSSNSTTVDTSGNGTSFIFGTVDVATDGQPKWTGVDALIIIEKNNVISLSLATEDTDDHFMGQPIYGIVDSMTDENGNELIDTGTQAAGNLTQGAGDLANETGEFLGNITEGIGDLFNDTGQ